MKTELITDGLIKLTADDGKIFAKDEVVLGPILYLGINDSPDNYKEIDEPADVDQTENPEA